MSENRDRGLSPFNPDEPEETPKPEANAEQELSPEVIQQIMEKVQDIDTKGIAYSRVAIFSPKLIAEFQFDARKDELQKEWRVASNERRLELEDQLKKEKKEFIEKVSQREESILEENIRGVFANGIQGGVGRGKKKRALGNTFKEYKKILSDPNVDARVHFNIVGRTVLEGTGSTEIDKSYWAGGDGSETITILFDLTGFTEGEPDSSSESPPPRAYRSNDPVIAGDWENFKEKNSDLSIGDERLSKFKPRGFTGGFDKEGRPKPCSEYGFVLSPRVPPRRFNGVVINGNKEGVEKRLQQIIQVMREIYKEKPENLLPIYKINGDLLWPKQISYEEVKKFVAERDTKKTQENSPPPEQT